MARNFLITGGNSGIGAATAIRLCESRGAQNIALVARNAERLEKTANMCRMKNNEINIFTLSGDLSKFAICTRVVDEAAKAMNGIDVLVSNHGAVTALGKVEEISSEDFHHSLAVNLTSHLALSKAALPYLKKSTSANIVFVSSVASAKPMKHIASYAAPKAGLDILTKILALEHVEDGIRVNAVNPGPVDTPVHETIYGEDSHGAREKFIAKTPIGRMATAEEMAKLIEFVASEANANMTGSVLITDGGFTIRDE